MLKYVLCSEDVSSSHQSEVTELYRIQLALKYSQCKLHLYIVNVSSPASVKH